jgi:hypothetical protein
MTTIQISPALFFNTKTGDAWKTSDACSTRLCADKRGYVRVYVNKRYMMLHRVVWEMLRGPIPIGMMIDHIDRNKINNRIENLRLVTPRENAINKTLRNKYIYPGISWNGRSRSWCASVMNGEEKWICKSQDARILYNAFIKKKREIQGDIPCAGYPDNIPVSKVRVASRWISVNGKPWIVFDNQTNTVGCGHGKTTQEPGRAMRGQDHIASEDGVGCSGQIGGEERT